VKTIEEYLSKPPMLRAPKVGKEFRLYIYRHMIRLWEEPLRKRIMRRNLSWRM
jgi:hypothetical protein